MVNTIVPAVIQGLVIGIFVVFALCVWSLIRKENKDWEELHKKDRAATAKKKLTEFQTARLIKPPRKATVTRIVKHLDVRNDSDGAGNFSERG